MRLAFVAAILASSVTPSASGQCAIKPIKPIPPIGCKDLTPQCVSDNSGHSYWTWVCVPSNQGDSSTYPTPPPHPIPAPSPNAPITPPSSGSPAISIQTPQISLDSSSAADVSWVKVGMPQQVVISGLTGHFKLTKEGGDSETGSQIEIWAVESLSQPAPEFWEIAFTDGKVGSIITNSTRLLQGDALTLAQRLFAELYPRGNADNSTVGKFLGDRDLTIQVKMFQMTSDKGNEETMRFQFDNGRSFEIKITVPVRGNPTISTTEFQAQ